MAVKIAQKINGEIISADSRQVYKGLDIGSGKVKGKWKLQKPAVSKSRNCEKMTLETEKRKIFIYKNIPHYCLDYVSPKKRYAVVDFKKCAERAMKDILLRGKTPIICGGTGFYISAITGGIKIPEVKPNWKLRKKLKKMPVEKLFEMLKKLSPQRAKNIDSKNPRRLIRAIEIARAASTTVVEAKPIDNRCRFMQIGIKLPEKELKKRIEKRVKKMFRDGLLSEVKKLKKQGLSWKRIYELGFEYKYPALFLQGKISEEEMLKRMILENWHYVKRQMTWFKKYAPETKWISNKKFI